MASLRDFRSKYGLPSRVKCSRQGVLDGRNGIPDGSWIDQKPPFLLDLQHQAQISLENVGMALMASQDATDGRIAKLNTSEIAAQQMLELSEMAYAASEIDFQDAMQLERVTDEDLGEARSVKFRTFSTPLYLILLLFLGIGEFAVTQAAFSYLFDDLPIISYAMTIATVAVSIGFAHLTGISWKRSHDKVNFPTDSVFRFWKAMGVLVLLFVLALASARAANIPIISEGVAKRWALGEIILHAPLYVVTFFILQFVLILVAMGASYNHYSLPLERLSEMEKRTQKRHKQKIKVLKSLEGIRFKLEQEKKNRPRLTIAARNEVNSLKHHYYSLSQTYQAANLRARSKTISQALAAFQPPTLRDPEWFGPEGIPEA
jgi:hypothetical protein